MAVLKNRAKMTTSSTGTGTITLGSADTGYQSFADAGVANGDVVRYVIEDGNNWEIGLGAYTSSGTTLSRTVSESSNSGAALNLSGSATVFITAAAEDLPNLYADNPVSAVAPTASGNNAVAIGEESTASGTDSISLGSDSDATQTESSALGKFAQATGSGSVSLGARSVASGQFSVALGGYTDATSTNAIAIGYAAQAVTGSGATAIGNSYASGANSFAAVITNNTSSYGATGAKGLAIGELAKATATNSIAIGDNATSTTANQIALGGTTDTVKISGAYTLPTSDGTANQVLTTDGSGAVTFADAGGAALELYAENPSSPTAPSATGTNAVAIGTGAISSGTESVALGGNTLSSGYKSFAAAIGNSYFTYGAQGFASVAIGLQSKANQTATVAIGQSSEATNSNAAALGFNSVASGSGSLALGNVSRSSGAQSISLGDSYASGADSFAAAIGNNTSTYGATATSSVSLGKLAKATGAYSTAIGESTQAQGSNSVCLGYYSQAQGQGTMVMGYDARSTAVHCTAIGTNTRNAIDGTFKFSGGQHSTAGDAQVGIYPVLCETTDATATTFVTYHSNTITPQTDNQIVLPNNSAYAFSGTIVARQKASEGTASAAWKIEGLIRREGSAGTTVLVNSAKTVLDNTPSWDVTLSADTSNGCLKIQGTGAASTNIRWSSTITTSELIYA